MATSYREWKQEEITKAVYNALAQVSMELDADEEEMSKAIEWFQIKFYEDGMCEEE